jgi:hypothetical protein
LQQHTTTFSLHYSDEQDLQRADAPGSEIVPFIVDADVESTG